MWVPLWMYLCEGQRSSCGIVPQVPFTYYFETESLIGWYSSIQTGWLACGPQDPLVSTSLASGFQAYSTELPFFPGLRGLASGPHACTTNTLLTESSSQLLNAFVKANVIEGLIAWTSVTFQHSFPRSSSSQYGLWFWSESSPLMLPLFNQALC